MDGPRDEILVSSVMTSDLITVAANASVAEARDLLQQHGIHHLLVMHDKRVVAVLSDRDILRSISPYVGTLSEQTRDVRSLLRPVFQFASYHPITVAPTASVLEAAALMLDHSISCLPVVDEHGDTIGLVTSRDLLRGVLACAVPPRQEQQPAA